MLRLHQIAPFLCLAIVACDDPSSRNSEDCEGCSAVVEIKASTPISNPAPDLSVSGMFSENDGKVTFEIELSGCPEGDHGLHIHAGKECGEDGSKALAHWDPLQVGQHGQVNKSEPHHAGDAGVVTCDAEGTGSFEITTDEWNLSEDDELNPVGQTVILHGIDASQRIGCGVIEMDGENAKISLDATTLKKNPSADIAGKASFSQKDGEVTVSVELSGCQEGMHGFHIHAGKECGEDGSKALSHWDPHEVGVHGQVGSEDPHHAGDVGAIECDADGNGSLSLTTDEWTLAPDAETNPIGQAVIVHGIDAANRVACGIIEAE